ncbi:MAG: hypothetical protein GY869_21400, partial [Planctomycetes bacterium]|nr:hypothetical protein [Planctomycetota bacterium]
MKDLLGQLALEFDKLRPQVVLPAKGCLKYDYLVPGGYYNEMWDWDGYFIGCHLASRSKKDSVYLKWLVLNFLNLMDDQGYIPGCITPQGPEEGHRRFALKPFLAQSAYWAAKKLDDFEWVKEGYNDQKKVIAYRENTQLDQQYGLFFWNHAIQSGADNNPAVGNDHTDRDMIFSCDINTYQLREYLSMTKIAESLNRKEDADLFQNKAWLLEQAIQKYLWFDRDFSYYNVRRDTGQAIKRVTFSNFLPLIQKLPSPQDGSRMINKYLWNETHLLSPYGLRSLSRQDKDYNNDTIITPCSNFQGPV